MQNLLKTVGHALAGFASQQDTQIYQRLETKEKILDSMKKTMINRLANIVIIIYTVCSGLSLIAHNMIRGLYISRKPSPELDVYIKGLAELENISKNMLGITIISAILVLLLFIILLLINIKDK